MIDVSHELEGRPCQIYSSRMNEDLEEERTKTKFYKICVIRIKYCILKLLHVL